MGKTYKWDLWDMNMEYILFTGTTKQIARYTGIVNPKLSNYYKNNYKMKNSYYVRPHDETKTEEVHKNKDEIYLEKAIWHLNLHRNFYVPKERKKVLLENLKQKGIEVYTTPSTSYKGDVVLWLK